MRFAHTAEQLDLRDAVRNVLDAWCPPAVVRAGPNSAAAQKLEHALDDLGIVGLLAAESDGGLELDENYLVPLMIESGRAAVPLPVIETVAVAPSILAGTERSQDWLSGGMNCTIDLVPGGPVRFSTGRRFLLRGGFGGVGDIDVVSLETAVVSDIGAVDGTVGLSRVGGGTVLATVDDPAAVELGWLRGVLGAAAELIGLSHRMLDMTVAYTKDRVQFGVPIGTFQAVKHHLATAALQLEFAEPAVLMAGAALAATSPDRRRAVSMAKALATDAAGLVARTAIQCHGAIAYTTEYDLQLYAKRAWALSASWGGAGWHREQVASLIGLGRTDAAVPA